VTAAAPMFLAALALLVPVLVTFLVRRQRQIVRVPSTMVWRLGAQSVAKSRRIRDVRRLLALLACLLGVGALVVAAAQPSGTRWDTTVYVVDVSASMSGAPLDEARTWLSREVVARGPNARIAIVLAGAEARIALAPSPPGPQVDRAIRSIVAEREVAAMDRAVTLAEGLASAAKARVVVLTDRPVESEMVRRGTKVEQRLFGRKGPVAPDNIGITALFTRTPPDAQDDQEREATVTVATSSTSTRRARLVVTHGGRVVAERRFEIGDHGEVTEHVSLRGAGHLVARVTPDDGRADANTIDDEASLDEDVRRPPRVALVRGKGDKEESASAYFIAKALRAAGVTDLVEVNAEEPAPSGVEIAVVLRDGIGRPDNVPAFLIGVEPKHTNLGARLIGKAEAHLRSMASEEPILRGVSLDDLTTLRAKVATPPRGARTLVDLDGGPTLIVGGTGSSSWVWLGIDPEASDLVLRVAFPVLVGNVLAHLGGASQVVVAKTTPQSEVRFEASEIGAAVPTAAEPRWRFPLAPPAMIAIAGAFFLALEAWLTFRKRWAT
jgi:Aerotolerance regulator N-terminal/von Willebrand factor type A domain